MFDSVLNLNVRVSDYVLNIATSLCVELETEAGEESPKVMPSAENRRKRNLERRDIAQALNFDDGRLEKLSSVKTAGTQT